MLFCSIFRLRWNLCMWYVWITKVKRDKIIIEMFPQTDRGKWRTSCLLVPCGSRMLSTKEGFVEVLEFTHFARIFKFNRTLEIGKKKEISHEIKVSVVMELVWVDTKMYRSQTQSLQKNLINNWIIGKSCECLVRI